jgi:hypothetical protein
LSRALRTSDAARDASAAALSATAHAAKNANTPGASGADSAAASVAPEPMPISAKLTTVSGLAHSCRKRIDAYTMPVQTNSAKHASAAGAPAASGASKSA